MASLYDYYQQRASWIAERDCDPDHLPTADWATERPRIYRQFLDSLGLSQMPDKCDLQATETGTFSGDGYVGTKLSYQILPGCWGSAHFYRPADLPRDRQTPAVLYTCGHHLSGVIGYQFHAIAWARRGYSCLIFDTIQQHDNIGDHHDFNIGQAPDWVARGFTAAGGEVYNGIRALDLLIAQPGVDPERIGVTGISGGGSQSFFLSLVDDRLKAVATACGVSSPDFAMPNRNVLSHCDCIFFRNVHARDVSTFAALAAPRALMYCFGRHDGLFTPTEFRTLYARTKAKFEQLGCPEKVTLVDYDGPHGYNHASTFDAIHDWFDTHVAGETHPPVDTLAISKSDELLSEPELSVYHGINPTPNYLDLMPRLLMPRGQVRLPDDQDDWHQIKQQAVKRLREEVFHLLDDVREPQTLEQFGDWDNGGPWRYAWHGTLDGFPQCVTQILPKDQPEAPLILVQDNRYQEALPAAGDVWEAASPYPCSVLGIEPRAAGMRAFHPDRHNHHNREGCLVGLTPTMLMVQDLHHLMPLLKELPSAEARPLYLYGKGEGAIAMLFYALLNPDPRIEGIILEDLPATFAHTQWQILRLLTVMDIPMATGLLAPTPLALVNRTGTHHIWYYVNRAYARLGASCTLHHHLPSAMRAMLEPKEENPDG